MERKESSQPSNAKELGKEGRTVEGPEPTQKAQPGQWNPHCAPPDGPLPTIPVYRRSSPPWKSLRKVSHRGLAMPFTENSGTVPFGSGTGVNSCFSGWAQAELAGFIYGPCCMKSALLKLHVARCSHHGSHVRNEAIRARSVGGWPVLMEEQLEILALFICSVGLFFLSPTSSFPPWTLTT